MPTLSTRPGTTLRAIPASFSSHPWGRGKAVGTLYLGPEGVAFHTGAHAGAPSWSTRGRLHDRARSATAGARARGRAADAPRAALAPAQEPVSWPEVMGRLEFSAGDWHCPRATLVRVEPGGWASFAARLQLGSRPGRWRGYVLRGDCTRWLAIPDAAQEMFEAWLAEHKTGR